MSKNKYNRKRKRAYEKAQRKIERARLLERVEIISKQRPETAEATNSKGHDEQEIAMGLREFIKRPSITDWCIATFTVVLAGASIYQFVIMAGQLDTMRKDQRAWINVKVDSISKPTVDESLFAETTIINTGKTPALHVGGDFYVEMIPNGKRPHFGEYLRPHILTSAGTLFPNAPYPIHAEMVEQVGSQLKKVLLSDTDKKAYDAGNAWIAIHGFLDYWDVFNTRHWIRFCTWQGIAGATFDSLDCARYNEIDGQQDSNKPN
jgi:hypothetical protein